MIFPYFLVAKLLKDTQVARSGSIDINTNYTK